MRRSVDGAQLAIQETYSTRDCTGGYSFREAELPSLEVAIV